MTKFPSLKCPICGKTYKEVAAFGNHMRKEHPGTIPDGWSDLRYAYFIHTGKSHGKCRECGKDTPWNETTGAYSKICGSEECRKKYRDRFMAGMRARYGRTNLLDDPRYRERMLTGRRISGYYEFADGGKVAYMGNLEKAFIQMLDKFFRFPSADIISPSPNRYIYHYENIHDEEHAGDHVYVPDFFIPSCNLEIELKSSGNERPRNLLIDVPKDACKDVYMIRTPVVNYCKVYEDDYYVFFQVFADLARKHQTGDTTPIKYISRSLLTSIYRDYIPDDCLRIIDKYIYKYSDKSVMKKPAKESDLPILEEIEALPEEGGDEDAPEDFTPEDVYGDSQGDEDEVFSEEDEDSEASLVGVNPMMYYELGEYAPNDTDDNATEQSTLQYFNIDDTVEPVTEALKPDDPRYIEENKIDGRAAIKYGKWRDKLFGNKLLGTKMAKAFTKVTVENGRITIKGINCNLLLYRIKKKYDEGKIKYIFQYRYNDKSWKMYQKKKIGRGDMKIDFVYAPEFFCLELVELFRDLGQYYRDASYIRIAEMVYEATWLSKADNTAVPPIDTSPLSNIRLELLPHQVEFIKRWGELKNQLNLHGYILSFKPGKGKTLTAVGLAECIKAPKVYIVCPNNLKDNWALELKKYFAKYDNDAVWSQEVCILGSNFGNPKTAKYLITNNENIKLMMPHIEKNPGAMLIVDECHNFRNYGGSRSKELFDLADSIGSHNVLCVSATPIKASPAEITPALRLIDPTFTDEAATMYAQCFDLNSTTAMNLVTKRFGMVIYRPADVDVDLPPKNNNELFLPVSNEQRYYLTVVHDEVIEDFKKRQEDWLKTVKLSVENFEASIQKYSLADRRTTNAYLNWVIQSSNSLRNDDFHELAVKEYKAFIDTYIRPNNACPGIEVERLTSLQNEFITGAKQNMGKAVGSILPKRRNEMFINIYDENRQTFYEMIRNRGKKTVIFSTMVPVVKHIVADLNSFGIGAVSITGETKDRLTVLTKFKEDPNTLVMVATSWCLGVGVTLTEASQMFFFGSPWRSTDMEQASDRIWRIGQTDEVDIYNVRMKSRGKNLSDRMQEILDWSNQMFDTAITANELGEDGNETPTPTMETELASATEYYGWNELPGVIQVMQRIMSDYKYGMNKNNRIVNPKDPTEYDRNYRSLSPGKFTKLKGGICFDYMAYQDFFYKAHGVTCLNYLIELQNPYETHTFTIVEYKNQFIYSESAFERIRGAWWAPSLDAVVSFIINNMRPGNPPKKGEYQLMLIKPNYGRYDETMDEILARFHKTGKVIPFAYDPTIKMIDEYSTEMEPAEEHHFNLNIDSDQYALASQGEMDCLQFINRAANKIGRNHVDLIEGKEGIGHGREFLMRQNTTLTTENAFSDFEVAYNLFCELNGTISYQFFILMIDGIAGKTVAHPLCTVPFCDGALLLEYGYNTKRNNIYFCNDVNQLVSAEVNWILSDLNMSPHKMPDGVLQVRLYALDYNDIRLFTSLTYDGLINNPIGKPCNVQYDKYCRELHKVEVLHNGWAVSRW